MIGKFLYTKATEAQSQRKAVGRWIAKRLNDPLYVETVKEEVFTMSEKDAKREKNLEVTTVGTTEAPATDPCADTHDPVRRGLCRVCQIPVVGEAPFCKDHEPPVP